eukprot:1380940-Amorphochlora_amoeboformis.AAC.1
MAPSARTLGTSLSNPGPCVPRVQPSDRVYNSAPEAGSNPESSQSFAHGTSPGYERISGRWGCGRDRCDISGAGKPVSATRSRV